MQVFRLWQVGTPDKLIAIDSLPEDLLTGIERTGSDGLPRHWKKFLEDGGDGRFYALNYLRLNKDVESWQKISNHVRKACEVSVRLMDKLEDMARPMAPDCKTSPTLEPEEIPVIPLPKPIIQAVANVVTTPVSVPVAQIAAEIKQAIETKQTVQNVSQRFMGKHTCKSGGKWGKYAPTGECVRCDQLKAAKLVPA